MKLGDIMATLLETIESQRKFRGTIRKAGLNGTYFGQLLMDAAHVWDLIIIDKKESKAQVELITIKEQQQLLIDFGRRYIDIFTQTENEKYLTFEGTLVGVLNGIWRRLVIMQSSQDVRGWYYDEFLTKTN